MMANACAMVARGRRGCQKSADQAIIVLDNKKRQAPIDDASSHRDRLRSRIRPQSR